MTTSAFGGPNIPQDPNDIDAWDAPAESEAATSDLPDGYRPMRAALGPSIHVVARDTDGRLWIRANAAAGAMVIVGVVLFLIPFMVFGWFANQMVENDRITIDSPVLVQKADKK